MLLTGLASGEKDAFDELYSRYAGKVYNFIRSLSDDPILAQDISQEVFIKVWQKRESFDPAQNFEAWLFVCSRNMFLNEVRLMGNRKKFERDSSVLKNEEDLSTSNIINYHFTKQSMAEIIGRMPPQRKKIYLLTTVYDLTVPEIARRMGISPRTVESQLYQARKFVSSQIKMKSQ